MDSRLADFHGVTELLSDDSPSPHIMTSDDVAEFNDASSRESRSPPAFLVADLSDVARITGLHRCVAPMCYGIVSTREDDIGTVGS